MLMPTQLFTQPKRNKSKRWGGRENCLLRKSKFIRNFYYNIIFILRIGVLCVHVPKRREDTAGYPGIAVRFSYEAQYGCWELKLGPLQKQSALLPSLPSLQYPLGNFFISRNEHI